MLFKRRTAIAVAGLLSLVLAGAACGGDDDPTPGPGGGGGGGKTGGSFSFQIGEPENPLVPGNTNETEGGQVIDALFTALVTYDTQTSELEFEGVADSIESDDDITWTVKLKDGWKFHDGSPVDAASFVDAWNYTALATNAQGNASFFGMFEGYKAVNPPDPDGDDGPQKPPAPSAKTLTGLKVVDDKTFEVRLSSAFSQFPLTLGYSAFMPLPKAFFTDVKGFGSKPIGNGQFKAETAFVKGQGMTVVRNEDYAGPEKAKADRIEIKVFTNSSTAYKAVQNDTLDIMEPVPDDNIATFRDDFPGRFVERENSTFQYLGFPTYDARFKDKRVRQAFSLAIDRPAITQGIFQGARQPAYSVINPVVQGHRDDACKYCRPDVARAKALLAEAGFDTSKPIDLWFNKGASHDKWVQAVGNQLRSNLGIEYKLQGSLDFDQYLPKADAKGFTGPFRLGWSFDYPSPQNYLEPLYSTKALPPNGSNASFYSNKAFDDKIAEANEKGLTEEGIRLYQEAEDILLEDMPIMPMFYGKVQAVFSNKVENVAFTAFSTIDLANVTVK